MGWLTWPYLEKIHDLSKRWKSQREWQVLKYMLLFSINCAFNFIALEVEVVELPQKMPTATILKLQSGSAPISLMTGLCLRWGVLLIYSNYREAWIITFLTRIKALLSFSYQHILYFFSKMNVLQGLKGDATYVVVTDDGKIDKFGINAVCTHLGCVVPWNPVSGPYDLFLLRTVCLVYFCAGSIPVALVPL